MAPSCTNEPNSDNSRERDSQTAALSQARGATGGCCTVTSSCCTVTIARINYAITCRSLRLSQGKWNRVRERTEVLVARTPEPVKERRATPCVELRVPRAARRTRAAINNLSEMAARTSCRCATT